MQNKKVLFRCDSSNIIGLGHVMRDLVLARQLQECEIFFATQTLKGNINESITKAGYKLINLPSNNVNILINIIHNYKINILVIDNYNITFIEEQVIKNSCDLTLLVLDDTYEKHHCDILLNHNLGADSSKYNELLDSNTIRLCGSSYTLIKHEVRQAAQLQIKKKPNSIFIMMGGMDRYNISSEIALLFQNSKYKLTVATTSSNPNLQYLSTLKNIALYVDTPAKELYQLMKQSQIGITTPSVSLMEFFYMKIPTIAIQTASNQSEVVTYLQNNTFDYLNKFDAKKLKIKVEKLFTPSYYNKLLTKLEMISFSKENIINNYLCKE